VQVFEGATKVGSAKTTASGGKWSTAALSPALPAGKRTFTAVATEKSAVGNAEGKSSKVSFEVDTEPPVVTLEPLALVSNDTTPAFSGTASETDPVTVEVFAGAEAKGSPVAKLTASVAGGTWKSAHLTKELENGVYTAIASEPSSLENAPGQSKPVSFEVDTKAPNVTMVAPAPRSSDTKPSFSGTVSSQAGKTVTVYIHEGSSHEGKIVRTVTAEATSGKWTSPEVAPALSDGTFTAVAAVPSLLPGNPEGESAPATFVVDTQPPTVTLNQPPSLSNDATPSFGGAASETTPVKVSIYRGATAAGTVVASVEATPRGGTWASETLGGRLEDGQYTAIAEEQSAIGNGPGKSAPVSFSIDTKPPAVTLNAIPTPSSDRVPSFSGTASEAEPVSVEIFRGAKPEGAPVVTLSGEVADGEWFTGAVQERLEWGEYTALAVEPSSIGNASGTSTPVTFTVAQIPPGVVTEGSASVTWTSAALYGAVNPLGAPVSACTFEVGTGLSYGRDVGCGFVSGALSFPRAAVGFVPVFIRIYGLKPGTTYHYRVVASSEGGTAAGPDKTFVTPEEPLTGKPPPTSDPSGPSKSAASGVASFFAAQLRPMGKTAQIGILLKNGLFAQRFKAPEAGTAVIKWYYLPPGAKLAKRKAPSPVLVASGRVTFHAAGTATMKIRLTAAGRRVLERSERVRLIATCAFKPLGGAAITTSGSFELRR